MEAPKVHNLLILPPKYCKLVNLNYSLQSIKKIQPISNNSVINETFIQISINYK